MRAVAACALVSNACLSVCQCRRGQRQLRVHARHVHARRVTASAGRCAVLNCLHRYIAESALGIVCPMSRVQQGGSQAVKTDSGLLPEFHLHIQLSRTFCDTSPAGDIFNIMPRRRLSAAVCFSPFHAALTNRFMRSSSAVAKGKLAVERSRYRRVSVPAPCTLAPWQHKRDKATPSPRAPRGDLCTFCLQLNVP